MQPAEQTILLAPYGSKSKTEAHKPNPTQRRVLEWVDGIRSGASKPSGIPVLYLQGGVGSGKSRAIMAPIIEMLLEIPGLRVLWGRNDFKDIKLSIMDKFFEILPPELIVGKSEQYHFYDIAQNEGSRSRIYFNSLKDLSGFSSQEFGIIAVTEAYEMSEQAYRTLKRRLRQEKVPVMMLMEGEAPNEDHWLAKLTNPAHVDYDPDITQWKVSTYENWDNLPEAYKTSLETMPESWKKKYLLGEYGFIPDGDPYYQGFKEIIHKCEIAAVADKELLLGWDYGFRHPACVITQIDAKGRWRILREVVGSNIIIDQFADVMKQYLNINFPGFSARSYGDPAGTQMNDKSEKTSAEILSSKGFTVTSCQSTYRDRKEIIEGKLATLIEGVPALTIDASCKVIIDGFLGGYHYPMIRQGQQFTAIKTEQPYKDGFYEHIMNCMEYIAVNIFKAIKKAAGNSAKRSARRYELANRKNAGFKFKR